MSRVLAHCVPREMALLGLFELALSALLIYALLGVPGFSGFVPAVVPGIPRIGVDLATALAFVFVATAATIGLYRPDTCFEPRRMLLIALLAGVLASPIILLLGSTAGVHLSGTNFLWLAKVLGIWLAALAATRFALSRIVRQHQFARRVLVIGQGERAARLLTLLRQQRGRLFEPLQVGADQPMLTAAALHQQGVWGVVVTDDHADDTATASLLDSKLRGIPVFGGRGFQEQHLGRIDLDTLDAHWFLTADGFTAGPAADVVKRVFDIVSSCLLLFATLPLMVIAAILIKLDSPGPVLYRQQRAGHFGAPFMLFKFRSMTVDAEAGGKPRWAQKHDPRVTRVGRFMRQSRIDELPQLFNVLRGDMSMIGPRPERPHFVEELSLAIPFYRQREYVKPGITGWAQINYPYGASVEDAREKLAYDLYYVKNRGLLLDLFIFCSTVRVILFREGAR